MTAPMRTLVLVLVSLGLTACCIQLPPPRPQPLPDDDGGALGPPLWPDGTVVFGTTDDNGLVFIPIDTQIELHRGPQGGHHTYAKYQVTGQTAAAAVFDAKVRRARDGLLVSRRSRTFDVAPVDGGVWTSEGSVVLFLCPTAPGVSIVREPLLYEVIVKSASGQFLGRASASATLKCTGCDADCGG